MHTSLVNTLSDIIENDPIFVNINAKGEGSVKLHIPLPKGFKIYLREVKLSGEPDKFWLTLNGDDRVPFMYENGRGILNHEVTGDGKHLELHFHPEDKVKRAKLVVYPSGAMDLCNFILPSSNVAPNYRLLHFYKFTDGSYRALYHQHNKRVVGIRFVYSEVAIKANMNVYMVNEHDELIKLGKNKYNVYKVGSNEKNINFIVSERIPSTQSVRWKESVDCLTMKIYTEDEVDVEGMEKELERLKIHLRKAEEVIVSLG